MPFIADDATGTGAELLAVLTGHHVRVAVLRGSHAYLTAAGARGLATELLAMADELDIDGQAAELVQLPVPDRRPADCDGRCE